MEIWKINDEAAISKKKERRRKRKPDQKAETEAANLEFEHLANQTLGEKITAIAFSGDRLIVALANNTVLSMAPHPDGRIFEIADQTQGHQTDIRCLAITADQIVSASPSCCRVWDFETGQCVSQIECGNASSMIVLPGDRFALIATNEGTMQMADLVSAEIYTEVQAHSKRIWSLSITADAREIASGSEDCEVRFWSLAFEGDRPVVVHTRTLKMKDEVYAVAYSPDGARIAVAVLDTNVQVLFTDTLNPHFVLYGAHLPVTGIAFSTDGGLIVTSSADKNIYIWGAEFGDRHRSLWQHSQAVSAVRFERETHMAWTVGRDGLVNWWDCDRFLCVQKLIGHMGEVWTLAVSAGGEYVVTGGRDKGIRVWRHTQEQLYVSIEQENLLRRRMEAEGAKRADRTVSALRNSVFGGAVSDMAARQSEESIFHGDLLADAVAEAEKEADPDVRIAKVLSAMRRINRANLDVVMASIPFHCALSLVGMMADWLEQGKEVELTVRSICALIKHHRTQLQSSPAARELLIRARAVVHDKVAAMKNRCGMNLAALRLISHEMKS
jgi:U3 small nucleolar RNA-associated protein 12